MTEKPIRLMDIPLDSKIYCECSDESTCIIFHHLDGMYSFCKTEKGAVAHLGVGQPLEKFKDGYKLASE